MNELKRRRFLRVKCHKMAQLDFADKSYGPNRVKDINLTGMFIAGNYKQKVGDKCTVRFIQEFDGSSSCFKARAKVVRLSRLGLAIEFLSMYRDSYILLQTTLLYEAEDPCIVGFELPENCPFKVIQPTKKKTETGYVQTLQIEYINENE